MVKFYAMDRVKTKLLKASEESVRLAVELLKKGEVVAVPTETVYGLAGDSRSPDAIRKIFEAKGRPNDNPLISHICDMEMFKMVAEDVSDDALKLAEAFWPGPLTLVLKKSSAICRESSAGLETVGVRMPSDEVARQIIKLCGFPFSAPSANTSGKPSPTTAQDVYDDMNGKIPLIVDGGECDAGVESTVISMVGKTPVLLRPGVVTKEEIETVLGKRIRLASGVKNKIKNDEVVLSPGMKYRHYAPSAKVYILIGNLQKFKKYVENYAKNNENQKIFVLCFDGEEKLFGCKTICYGKRNSPKSQAHRLFSALRELDRQGAEVAFARCPRQTGVSLAVYNRLIRSAGFDVVRL